MEVLGITEKALSYYRENVKGNKTITPDQALLKMIRNVTLVKETHPERVKKRLFYTEYAYGNMTIKVNRKKQVFDIVNKSGCFSDQNDWKFPKRRYIELSKELGIKDCKISKITYSKKS
ncbi:hypothetical protein FVD40_06235 [Bacillus subtilis]|uniref:Uncharacterized protein n=1 Tax=Bacillus subtilis TaxID=1423 RepID=A0A8I1WIL8_BACIU|nr:hypothetical protein [Bacillus subtilis]AMR46887.1 hypothetical protein KHRBS_10665 [Bacillus subtilis subsp. subtilis]MBO3796239.1 hypothetical protein [Bacillus subtilis]MEC1057838.1 hypothetical protein [Bacillus subtilis]OTQ88003.1 hypothetical protein BG30_02100 [Bacillus subtilis subsp. subtilis]TXK63936.1 hypothetical protein FVD40_06235 [Bacillus subtilis]